MIMRSGGQHTLKVSNTASLHLMLLLLLLLLRETRGERERSIYLMDVPLGNSSSRLKKGTFRFPYSNFGLILFFATYRKKTPLYCVVYRNP